MKDWLASLLILILIGGSISPKKISHKLESSIGNTIGQIEHMDVQLVDTSRLDLLAGHIGTIKIDLRGFEIKKEFFEQFRIKPKKNILKGKIQKIIINACNFQLAEFTIDELRLELTETQYDFLKALLKRKLQLVGMSDNSGILRVSAANLSKLIKSRMTQLQDLQVQLQPGQVILEGKYEFLALPIPIKVSGRLQVIDGTKIQLVNPHIRIVGMPLPDAVAGRLLQKMNLTIDIKDLMDLPFSFQIAELKVSQDFLNVAGKFVFE